MSLPEAHKWAFMTFKKDPDGGHLNRFRVVKTPWFGVYLHWLTDIDTEPYPHNHTWSFYSLILRGGYTEEYHSSPGDGLNPEIRSWDCMSLHKFPLSAAHRIVEVQPKTMTLVVTGPKVRSWGFWTKCGPVRWKEYLSTVSK